MSADSNVIMLNGGRDVGVALVAGADTFLTQLLSGAPSKTGAVTLKVVKNASGIPFVAVILANKHVGFLSHADAEGLLPVLADCEQQGAVAAAKALLAVAPEGSVTPALRLSLASPDRLLGVPTVVASGPVATPPEAKPAPERRCQGCGTLMPADAKFCLACGTPVAAIATPQQGAVVAAQPAPVTQPRSANMPVETSPMPAPLSAAQPGVRPFSLSPLSLGGHVVALIGSLMLLISPFLPWMSVLWVSASGFDKTSYDAILLLVLGVIGVTVSVVGLLLRRRLAVASLFLGLVGLAIGVWDYVQMHGQLADADLQDMGATIASGIYLGLVGAAMMVVGGALVFAGRNGMTPRPSQLSATSPKKRGWWGSRGRVEKGMIVAGAVILLVVIAVLASVLGGGDDEVALAPSTTSTTHAVAATATSGVDEDADDSLAKALVRNAATVFLTAHDELGTCAADPEYLSGVEPSIVFKKADGHVVGPEVTPASGVTALSREGTVLYFGDAGSYSVVTVSRTGALWGIYENIATGQKPILYVVRNGVTATSWDAGGSSTSQTTEPTTMTTAASSGASVALTGADIVAALKSAGLPIADIQDNTDPNADDNQLMGRPNQYVEATHFRDTQIDASTSAPDNGVVEVFLTPDDAKARKAYVDEISKDMPTLGYYSYQAGVYVLRLVLDVPPDRAKAYEAAFLKIIGEDQ